MRRLKSILSYRRRAAEMRELARETSRERDSDAAAEDSRLDICTIIIIITTLYSINSIIGGIFIVAAVNTSNQFYC